IREHSGIAFTFDRGDRHKHANTYTFYLKYAGPLPAENDVKVDITIREHLAFPIQHRPVLRGYDEFADVPEGRVIQVYSLEEIAAEKVLALADKARNEPRDLYDLWYLTIEAGIELEHLIHGIQEKLEFRAKTSQGLEAAILQKEKRLEPLWANRLGHQMARLPQCDEVFRKRRRTLRAGGLP